MKEFLSHAYDVITSKYFSSKLFIFLTLGILSVLFYVFGTLKTTFILRNDFWINLSAGTVGSLITIFFIDSLLNKEKLSRLKQLNRVGHQSVLQTTRHLMAKQMLNFDYIKKDEFFSLLDNAEDKFKEFINSEAYAIKMKGLEKFDKDTGKQLAIFQKELDSLYKSLLASLSEIKPFADPKILEFIRLSTPAMSGRASVGVDLIDLYYGKLPKEIPASEVKKIQPAMDILWKVYVGGFFGKEKSLKEQYDAVYKVLLEINEKAKRENLFYDVN